MLNKSTWDGWNQSNPALKNSYSLKGWGVGVRGQIARIVQLELVDARKIGDTPARAPPAVTPMGSRRHTGSGL